MKSTEFNSEYFDEQLDEREEVFRFDFFRASGDAPVRLPDGLRWMTSKRFFSLIGDLDGLLRWIDPLLSTEGSLDEFRPESGLAPDLKSANASVRIQMKFNGFCWVKMLEKTSRNLLVISWRIVWQVAGPRGFPLGASGIPPLAVLPDRR